MALGLVVGTVLGLFGGGGSILGVPALVYGLGLSVGAAVPTSLIVVGLAAAGGLAPHLRRGCVAWRTGLIFGGAGIGGSFLGAWVNRRLPEDVVLVAFAVLMLGVAGVMFRSERAARGFGRGRDLDARRVLGIVATGFLVGILTGLFGVGGGFMIVPALVLLLGLGMPVAVGTSLLVMVVNAASGIAAHLRYGTIDLVLAGTFAGAAVVGSLAGGWIGGRVDASRIRRGFAVLIVAVAVFVLAQVLVLGPVRA